MLKVMQVAFLLLLLKLSPNASLNFQEEGEIPCQTALSVIAIDTLIRIIS